MRKYFIYLCFIFLSCSSVDIDKNVNPSGIGKQGGSIQENNNIVVFQEPDVIYIEKPVFIPEKDTPPNRPGAGTQTVRESNDTGIIKPQDYSHAAIVYSYNPDWVYEAYTQPLRVTDIVLEPGERSVEAPFVSDSERWILGAGLSFDNGIPVQHIYVKPAAAGLEATLIINTDRRVYRIILRSYRHTHMPIVRWRYLSSLPNNLIPNNLTEVNSEKSLAGVDPQLLSFNYRMTYGLFNKPVWLPELVFDDGSKTYIVFPSLVLQREFPSVFENRKDVVNYRVSGNMIIIDKLIEQITVKIERNEITIAKKRGKNGK